MRCCFGFGGDLRGKEEEDDHATCSIVVRAAKRG